jgi:hypothetical protein
LTDRGILVGNPQGGCSTSYALATRSEANRWLILMRLASFFSHIKLPAFYFQRTLPGIIDFFL